MTDFVTLDQDAWQAAARFIAEQVRSDCEVCCRGSVNEHTAPAPHSVDPEDAAWVAKTLDALRGLERSGQRADLSDMPPWVRDVIDGRIDIFPKGETDGQA